VAVNSAAFDLTATKLVSNIAASDATVPKIAKAVEGEN